MLVNSPGAARACREQLKRLLAGETFRSAPALRGLLEYLVEQSLSGRAESLKEFTIGVEALGRPASYDPQADPSVRVQVSRLRKRLEDYYAEEGADDPIRFRLPKRHFVVEFEAPEETPADPAAFWRRLSFGLAAAAIALGWAALGGGVSSTGEVQARPFSGRFNSDMREFWAPHLESDRPTILSLGVGLFVRVPGRETGALMRQTWLNEWPPPKEVPGLSALAEALGGEDLGEPEGLYIYSGVGEAIGAYILGKSLSAAGLDLPIVRSPYLSWDEVKTNNVIFVGAPKFNRQIKEGNFERSFRVVRNGIENVAPRPGEQAFFERLGKIQPAVTPDVGDRYWWKQEQRPSVSPHSNPRAD